MKSMQEHNWNIPQRQASAGLVVILYKAVLTMVKVIWPILLVVLFRERDRHFDTTEILLVGIPAFILLRSLIDFFYFRFYIEKDDLIIRKGFLSKKVITIPIGKIQSVHIEQNLIHQALDVAKLTIDTAGSEKAEAEIDAISMYKAENFRKFLLQNQNELPAGEQSAKYNEEIPLISLSTGDIFRLGLSANHLQAFFIVFAFAVSMVQNLDEIFDNRILRIAQESFSTFGISMGSIIALVVLVLIVSVTVSVGRIILSYSNFKCSETEKGFRIQTGLINARQNLVPFSKIQYISWGANWVRRKIGLFMLEFHQAQNEQARRKQRIRIPVTKEEYIGSLLQPYHPAVKSMAHSVHSMHKVYPVRRMLLSGIPAALILSLVFFGWIQWYALLFFLWVPYVYAINVRYRKRFCLYISPEAFQLNSGVWGKESKLAQWYKIQHLELVQSIYQRRKKIATLVIHTAGGKIKIPYIDLEVARMIINYALYKVEGSEQSWM